MEKFDDGEIIEGKVTGIEKYGVFLSFGKESSGLIHISELSNNFVKDTNEYAKINDVIKAKIIGKENQNHYKLSVKELEEGKNVFPNEEIIKKGFNSLMDNLDIWIDETINKIDKTTK